MNKIITIISIILFTILLNPFNVAVALHDDERIGKGGAWESDNAKREKPDTAENNQVIDSELDKTFKKSPIVIPDKEKESSDPELDNPKNKETENSDSLEQQLP